MMGFLGDVGFFFSIKHRVGFKKRSKDIFYKVLPFFSNVL